MIRITQIKLKPEESEERLLSRICKKLRVTEADILSWQIRKKSLDARKKDALTWIYQVDVELNRKEAPVLRRLKESEAHHVENRGYEVPPHGTERLSHRPVIVGTGPAGLFCGYLLAKEGYAPVLLERGGPVEERSKAVEQFWNGGPLDPECNVQFGEGGAGTFSDGKLNTLVKDPALRGQKVLEIFAAHGAGEEILYEQKPHIGTDVLKKVLRSMRKEIEAFGGTFQFHTKLTDLECIDGMLCGIQVQDTKTGELRSLSAGQLILAVGHSARDTFAMLKARELFMRPKSFAVGLRIEHPQSQIQLAQYGAHYAPLFPAAPYKVTAKASDGRGVYSFCMCPGGQVVNASSEPGRLAVNGMSYHARAGRNANSAMIVTVTPADFGDGIDPMSGVEFQRTLEERAFTLGGGAIPMQLFGDFKENRESKSLGAVLPDHKGESRLSNLRELLPEGLSQALIEGISQCGRRLTGFDRYDAVLSGVESRTSSPLRIERNESMEANIHGIYPCGEGAGYAGGITSAAMDGLRVAETLIARFAPAAQ